ncbi:hypothetical protein [Neomegalonema perideroedes]|uniref:hypothetical protein n=1 Tax=Neomegalonema perideroedes TaxID=217219 RepID=UPI00037323E1|nr:hypothetical protein [Neomegalonema perideroedes]
MRARSHVLISRLPISRAPARLLAAGVLAFAAPAFAQEPEEDPRVEEAPYEDAVEAPPSPSPEEALDKAAFMARASGKVVVYADPMGLPYGEEYFDPNGRDVTWRYVDGGCQKASWTAQGSLFCFAYDEPSCWRVRGEEAEGEWTAHLVRSSSGEAGQWVRMVGFEDRSLQCAPDFVAMAEP